MNDIFTSLSPIEVILPEYLKDYNEGMAFFHKELTVLNTNIFIIKKIIRFPLDLFCPQSTFFFMVIKNFFEYSIIIISRIFIDNYSDCFSIQNFRDNIEDKYINQKYKMLFKERLNNIKFDYLIEDIKNRVRFLRSKRIAHSIKKVKKINNVDFDELEILINYINSFFYSLSFNTGFEMLFMSYSKKAQYPKNSNSITDIDKILDSVAKESNFLNTPERYSKYPSVWLSIKKNWTKEKLDIFYKYREKLGFPKI